MATITYEFDPRDFAVLSFQQTPTTAKRSKYSEHHAVALLDGTMYSDCSGTLCASPDYFVSDKRTGIHYPGKHPSAGFTFSIMRNGNISILDGAKTALDYMSAVQLYPDLIRNSKNVANSHLNTDDNHRAALGINAAGRLMFAIGHASMYAFTNDLLDHGMKWAGYTDGGGSTELFVSNQRHGSTENRAVAMWFAELTKDRRAGQVSPIALAARSVVPSLSFLFPYWS